MLIGHSYVFLCEVSVQYIYLFRTGLFSFNNNFYRSSYILDVSPLLLCVDIIPENSVVILTMQRSGLKRGLTN